MLGAEVKVAKRLEIRVLANIQQVTQAEYEWGAYINLARRLRAWVSSNMENEVEYYGELLL